MAACESDSGDEEGRGGGGATAVGAAMATIGGILISHGDSENHGTHLLVWLNLWFAAGCALLALGTATVGVSLLMLILRWVRSRKRGSAAELAHSYESPLRAVVVDEELLELREGFCVFALKVDVTNLTEGLVNLIIFNLDAKSGGKIAPISSAAWNDISDKMTQMKQKHASDLLAGPMALPSLNRIGGWLVSYGTVPIAEGGRPACTLSAVDDRGDSYEWLFAARPQQRYKSPDRH